MSVLKNGVHYELDTEQCPDKQFYYPETVPVCPNMKTITRWKKYLHVLKTGDNQVHVTDSLRARIPRNLWSVC